MRYRFAERVLAATFGTLAILLDRPEAPPHPGTPSRA